MIHNIDIITSAARMGADNYEQTDFPLGAEQRFIGALLNSHLNNLEEQYLLGVDYIETSWINQHGVKKDCKKYYDGESATPKGYYILYTKDFSKATGADISNYPVVADDDESADDAKKDLVIYDLNNSTLLFAENIASYSEEKISLDTEAQILAQNDAGFEWDIEVNNIKNLKINPGFTYVELIQLWFRPNASVTSDLPKEEVYDILIAEKYITINYTASGKKEIKEVVVNKWTEGD